jgi:hypothetical protein
LDELLREFQGMIAAVTCSWEQSFRPSSATFTRWLDRKWQTRGSGVLLRHADDLLALCKASREVKDARATPP